MKQLFKHFALLVMGALISGCAEEVDDLQPTTNGTVTMKTTISLSEQASTRALTEAGVKTFEVGDKIAVIYKNTNDETMKVVSAALTTDDIDATDAHKATFSVSLTNPKASTPVRYIYPASRAAETVATTTAPNDDATIKYDVLATQVGTFDKIASDLDLSVFDGDMTAQAVLPAATLTNPLTIAKFTIKNGDGTSDLTSTITGLTINDGTNTYAITRTAAAGPIYVAMKPIAGTKTVTVDATDGTNNYTKSVSGNALAASSIYTITVKALKIIDLSQITAAYTAQNGEVLTGTLDVDNYPVKISIADGATVTLNGLTINGTHANDDAHKHAGITCEGDATIILADGSVNTVRGFNNNYPGILVGGTGTTLTINAETEGTGILNVTGGSNGAAGIGTGYVTSVSTQQGGNITISGGKVTSQGGENAAGIGTGYSYIGNSQCGNITIKGGEVTAQGGKSAAGIGTGYIFNGTSQCGNITIEASVICVKAKRGQYGHYSIGRGHSYSTAPHTIGTITFGTAQVYGGTGGTDTWDASINFNVDGNYGPFGGLNLAISTETNANDTWTLTPVAP